MQPVKTERCNIVLTGDRARRIADLHAVRGMLFDTTAGETEQDGRLGFLTEWAPTESERAALAAGANVQLRLYGGVHPPVSLGASEATDPTRAAVAVAQIGRALGVMHERLAQAGKLRAEAGVDLEPLTRAEFYAAFERALDDVNAQQLEALQELREALDEGLPPEAEA